MTPPRPRPGILDVEPYVGGESSVPGVNRVIKLASNESALGPSPKAIAALNEAARTVHRYPDGSCAALRDAIAALAGIDGGRIVCGAGSDELIAMLCRAYAGEDDDVLHTEHGFLMYAIAATAAGARPVAAAETDLTADVDALLARVGARTRIVFLANPNNPTGTYLPATEVVRLREGLREDVLLVIDAAYAEYMEAADYTDGCDLVDRFPNVVVTRTFSKIYALGGARLGWAYCPAAVADVLNRVRNPFNVSSLAQAAGLAALADRELVARARTHNTLWRRWTTERLRALGLDVPESHGNFVLVRFGDDAGRDAAAADAFLRRHGIIARRMGAYGLKDCLRVTIGREDEMQAFVGAVADFCT